MVDNADAEVSAHNRVFDLPICALVDFAERGDVRRTLLYADPIEILETRAPDEIPALLDRVQRATRDGLHAVGFVSYDAAAGLAPSIRMAPKFPAGTGVPLAWFALTRAPEEIDLDAYSSRPFTLGEMRSNCARNEYDRAIADVLEQIGRGDLYQLNYTFKLHSTFEGDDIALYRQLRDAQTWGNCARYSAYLNLGRWRILSASPELFFRKKDTTVEVRPMKGTAKRGRWLEEDEMMESRLRESAKERAENVMITDLLRNDLGKIARIGTVRVPALLTVERYPTVLQLTSTVTASVAHDTTLLAVFRALFPPGSVTGAPKQAAVDAIDRLESDARGVYCGSIGVVSPQGDAAFNVAIRTLTLDTHTGRVEYGVGGGITADSNAANEYDEALLKASVLTTTREPMHLLETLRLQEGVLIRFEQHLARMSASARYFGFADPTRRAREVATATADTYTTGTYRLRLLASPDGLVEVKLSPFSEPWWSPFASGTADEVSGGSRIAPTPRTIAIAERPVNSDDVLLYHKTNSRGVYDAHRAAQPDAWDILLWNAQREVTEFTIGNVVFEWNGELCTPPRDCGLLAGVLRAEELIRGRIHERRLLVDDIPHVGSLWLINSLRGWVPVQLR